MKYGPCLALDQIPCVCGHPHRVLETVREMIDASVYESDIVYPVGACSVCSCQTFERAPK